MNTRFYKIALSEYRDNSLIIPDKELMNEKKLTDVNKIKMLYNSFGRAHLKTTLK